MHRVNLVNYRYLEVSYRKLRVYAFVCVSIIAAIIINLAIYLCLELKIYQQKKQNFDLQQQVEKLVNSNLSISKIENSINNINSKVELIRDVRSYQQIILSLLKELNQIFPQNAYLNQLTWHNDNATFAGITINPISLADFLNKLRVGKGIFYSPLLKTNHANDGVNYNFLITVKTKNQRNKSSLNE